VRNGDDGDAVVGFHIDHEAFRSRFKAGGWLGSIYDTMVRTACERRLRADAWLKLADFGQPFAPKNPQLGHAQDIPPCPLCRWWISDGESNAELARGHHWRSRFVDVRRRDHRRGRADRDN
jgi:hypothetical protein